MQYGLGSQVRNLNLCRPKLTVLDCKTLGSQETVVGRSQFSLSLNSHLVVFQIFPDLRILMFSKWKTILGSAGDPEDAG